MAGDPLESLRCPKGCDTRFLQYLIWDAPGGLKVCTTKYSALNGSVYDIGLRCADCSTWFGVHDITAATKRAFDDMLARTEHALTDFKDDLDDARLRKAISVLTQEEV